MAWQNVFLTKRLSQDADEMSSWQFVFLTKHLLTANYAFFCGYSLKFQQIGWCKRFYKYPVRTKPTTGSKYRNVTKTHRFLTHPSQTIHKSIKGNLWQQWSDLRDHSRYIFRPAKAAAGPIRKSVKEQTKTLNEQVTTLPNKTQFWKKRTSSQSSEMR